MMKLTLLASAALFAAQAAVAGGLDRSGQPIGIIFEKGNYAELSFSSTTPSLTGVDVLTNPIANVGVSFTTLSGGLKYEFSDKFSMAIIADQPYGVDVAYGGAPGTTMLGGTAASAETFSLTAVGRYKFSDRFSAHAGLRYQTINADVTLSGLAYGPLPPGATLNTYNADMSTGDGFGFLAGAAFEIPEYAMRVALTYNSEITHQLSTLETIGGVQVAPITDTEIKSPASINLDFQTGINERTLVFGSVRYAKWSDLVISPTFFDAAVDPVNPNSSISDLEDTWSFSLGVGRKVTDNLSVSAVLGYEPTGTDDLVSPLSPTNGSWSVGLGGRYTMDNVTLSGGIRYTMVGDALPETGTPDTARASFTGNDALSLGFKVGFNF